MSPSPLYTLGYARWSIEEVERELEKLDATLIDVRRAPHSSKPGFSKEELKARFDDRYVHLPGFGNRNYTGGPIELADPEGGLQILRSIEGSVVLMCGCIKPERCHRTEVARFVVNHEGGSVTHLAAPAERIQPDLFDDVS